MNNKIKAKIFKSIKNILIFLNNNFEIKCNDLNFGVKFTCCNPTPFPKLNMVVKHYKTTQCFKKCFLNISQ